MSGNNQTMGVAFCSDLRTAIQAMITRTPIVSYGIIKNIPADGIVEVEISVSDGKGDLEIITCVLANIASDNFTLNIKPKVDDKVLVVFPNKFDPDMFDKSKNEVIVSDSPSGYDLFSGIAILMNQYKTNDHKNVITIDDGGTFTFTSAKAIVSLDSNGYISYEQTESGNNTLFSFSDNGFTIQDKAGNKIVSDTTSGSESIIINNHLKVKK